MHWVLREFTERIASDLVVLLGFLAAFGFMYYRRRLPEWFRSARADGWRIAQGAVETGDVTVIRTAVEGNARFLQRELARATLGYSYQMDGNFYAGHYSQAFMDEQKAWDFVHAWKGRTLVVRCHPNRPELSVLRLKEQSTFAESLCYDRSR
jgi:hypothetical protein